MRPLPLTPPCRPVRHALAVLAAAAALCTAPLAAQTLQGQWRLDTQAREIGRAHV